jgi:hypothetical protein
MNINSGVPSLRYLNSLRRSDTLSGADRRPVLVTVVPAGDVSTVMSSRPTGVPRTKMV